MVARSPWDAAVPAGAAPARRAAAWTGLTALLLVVCAAAGCHENVHGAGDADALFGPYDVDPEVGPTLTWVADPQVPGDETLMAGWGIEEERFWVVGDRGVVLSRRGGAWNREEVPTDARLEDIIGFGPTDLFVVGAAGTVLHYGEPPAPADADAGGARATDAGPTAGDTVGPSGPRWTLEAVPTGEDLLALAGPEPNDLWLVGTGGVVLHRTAAGYEPSPTGFFDRLADVETFADGAVVAVGDFGTVLRRVGDTWQRDGGVGTSAHLNALWGTAADDLVVVGLGGLVLRLQGGAWTRIPTDVVANLRGVWGRSFDDLFVVGWQGTVLRLRGGTASRIVPGEAHRLEGVFGGLGPHVFLLGSAGSVLVGPTPPPGYRPWRLR